MKKNMKVVSSVIILLSAFLMYSLRPLAQELEDTSDLFQIDSETEIASGSCGSGGDQLTWKIIENDSIKTLIISGKGRMEDYSAETYDDMGELVNPATVPWYSYDYDNIIVNEGVTYIGDYAFYSSRTTFNTPISVTLPQSLLEIGKCAFIDKICTLSFPQNLKVIGEGAFANTNITNMTSLDFPDSLETIGKNAFGGEGVKCTATSIHIPSNVRIIDGNPFHGCDNVSMITVDPNNASFCSIDGVLYNKDSSRLIAYPGGKQGSFTVPNSVTYIGEDAFHVYRSEALTGIILSNRLIRIGEMAFRNCKKIQTITIPCSVQYIDANAFEMTGLTSIEFENESQLKEIGEYAFSNMYSLTSISLPNGVDKIGRYAFNSCMNLIEIKLPDSISVIEDGTLSGCNNLEVVSLPDSITSIGDYAFISCSKITNIVVPGLVSNIGDSAFFWCKALTDVYIYNSTAPDLGDEAFVKYSSYENKPNDITIHVPLGATGYNTSPWNEYSIQYDISLTTDISKAVISLDPERCLYNRTWQEPIVTVSLNGKTLKLNDDYTCEYSNNYNVGTAQVTVIGKGDYSGSVIKEFQIDPIPPIVSTRYAKEITKKSALLAGYITDDGGDPISKREIVYWSKNNPSATYTVITDTDFSIAVKNLAPGTTYYYYAKATNSIGERTGRTLSFDTLSEDAPLSIFVSPNALSIGVNDTYQLYATVYPSTISNRNVVWSSSSPGIVKVDNNGKITALRKGHATITATTEARRLSATCTVTISESPIKGEFDFSEWNMATNLSNYADDGFDYDVAVDGFNHIQATTYLARWDGAVLESNDEYQSVDYYGDFNDSSPYYHEVDSDYHVQEAIWIPAREEGNSLDNNEYKSAVLKYGAAYASFYVNWNLFSEDNTTYYYPQWYSGGNGWHAVTIVGWDDNYSASNFVITPPGNGAFICKNSWGENWGDNGYFYVSYYDKEFGRNGGGAVFPSIESNSNYNTIYQYDPLGPTRSKGCEGEIWASNVFPEHGQKLKRNETLRAVSFYTRSKNVSYEIYVKTNYLDRQSLSNLSVPVASGVIEEMGYHTILLDKAISLYIGNRFAVIVKVKSQDEFSWMSYECPLENFDSMNAKANKDESYYSPDGVTWYDLTDEFENTNFCIKAFTDNGYASSSSKLYTAIDNNNRNYESSKIYTLDELVSLSNEKNENGSVDSPINNDYIDYINNNAIQFSNSGNTDDGFPPAGVVPSVVEIGDNDVTFNDGIVIPSKYDLRDERAVTGIRNQGNWGTCWAHSMYASLESCLLKRSRSISRSNYPGSSSLNDMEIVALSCQQGIEPISININKSTLNIAQNTEYPLQYTILPEGAPQVNVTWSSEDPEIAEVNTYGIVYANAIGSTKIHATIAGTNISTECTITVSSGASVSDVRLSSDELSKEVGDIFIIDYDVLPENATNKSVEWACSNPDIIDVKPNGLLEALKAGETEITITTKESSKTAICKIIVIDNQSNPEIEKNGKTGDCEWEITGESDNYTLTISGTGKMNDYASDNNEPHVPWIDYVSGIKHLVIFNGVTRIGNNSFANLLGLSEVPVIPESVSEIGMYAFNGCSNMSGNLLLPSNLKLIDTAAFQSCSKLSGDLTVPEKIKEIADLVFLGCSGLNGTLILPQSTTKIGVSAFKDTSITGDIHLGKNVLEIGAGAFNSTQIKRVYFKGAAPTVSGADTDNPSFSKDVHLFYYPDSIGWKSPTWNGYTAEALGNPVSVETWKVSYYINDNLIDQESVNDKDYIMPAPDNTQNANGFIGWVERDSRALFDYDAPIERDTTLDALVFDDALGLRSGKDNSLMICDTHIYMIKGQTYDLPAFSDDGRKYVWNSSNNQVVRVSKNKAKAQNITSDDAHNAFLKNGIDSVEYQVHVVSPYLTVVLPNENETTRVSKKGITITTGEKVVLSVGGLDNYRTYYPVFWCSSNREVASVKNGEIYAHSKGTTKISAYINGKAYTATIKVNDVAKVTKVYDRITLKPLQSVTLQFSDGFNVKKAIWTSKDLKLTRMYNPNTTVKAYQNNVVRLTSGGKLTAVGPGMTTLVGTLANGTTKEVTVTVTNPVTRVVYTNVGKSKTITHYNAKGAVKWSSDAEGITGKVVKGKFKATTPGRAVITCEYDPYALSGYTQTGFTYKTIVYVEDVKLVCDDAGKLRENKAGIKYALTLNAGDNYLLKTAGNYQHVIFASKTPSIAFVDEYGIVHAKAKGKTTISTKVNGKTISIALVVQ